MGATLKILLKVMKRTILKESVQKRVASLIVSKVRGAVSIYSEAPVVSNAESCGSFWYEITVEPTGLRSIMTFAEIDSVREAVDEYSKKYHGISYHMETKPYLASDNETWLSLPVVKISVQRYEEDIFNK